MTRREPDGRKAKVALAAVKGERALADETYFATLPAIKPAA